MNSKIDFYKNLEPYLTCKDYTVSGEGFLVKKNNEYDMLVTVPVPQNISKYYQSEDYISHTDSKKSLFDRAYHFVKSKTLKNKLKLINSFALTSKKILDIGAGTADFLKVCKNNSWQVFGVEPNKKARSIASNKGIDLQENIAIFKNKTFDVITLWHVLEHVENLEEYILHLEKMLANNGKLIIAVPNHKSYDALYYGKFWAAYDVPRHLWHFSKTSIAKLFSTVNMNVEKILPMKFDAYYVSLLSEKYKRGKMRPLQAFWIGFSSNWKAKSTNSYSSLIYVLKKN